MPNPLYRRTKGKLAILWLDESFSNHTPLVCSLLLFPQFETPQSLLWLALLTMFLAVFAIAS